MYGTNLNRQTYTGSENIAIENNQISLSTDIEIYDETIMNPRAYKALFQLFARTHKSTINQNIIHGRTQIATFYSEKKCIVHGDVTAPDIHMISNVGTMLNNIYKETYIDTLISNYYEKTY